jgi:hypothetical protein
MPFLKSVSPYLKELKVYNRSDITWIGCPFMGVACFFLDMPNAPDENLLPNPDLIGKTPISFEFQRKNSLAIGILPYSVKTP